jgi:hypothetical protein
LEKFKNSGKSLTDYFSDWIFGYLILTGWRLFRLTAV